MRGYRYSDLPLLLVAITLLIPFTALAQGEAAPQGEAAAQGETAPQGEAAPQGETAPQGDATEKAPPYPGSWGVQLQVSDVFRDTSDMGTRLLVKRMGGSYAGFRLGTGIAVNWGETTVDSTGTYGKIQSNAYVFDLSAEMLFHPIRDRPVQPYFGFGVVFAYSNLSLDSEPDLSEVSGSATGFGGVLTLGGEWYAVDRLSFYAEYGLQIMSWSSSGEYSPESGTGAKIDSTQGGLSTRGVVFGLGFYF